MIGEDDDHLALGKPGSTWHQSFTSVEADIESGLFDEIDDDRIDSDGNPLEETEDEEFTDDEAEDELFGGAEDDDY